MNRIMGMMPQSEVEKTATYEDSHGSKITIEAGPNGWTVIYADHSTEYNDVVATTEENFGMALKTATESIGPLITEEEGQLVCVCTDLNTDFDGDILNIIALGDKSPANDTAVAISANDLIDLIKQEEK